jgi:glycosyltransferase involved in cell wall biosynthesis
VTVDGRQFDRLIVDPFDPARPSAGGIDTCIRGLLSYAPEDVRIAVVGVDATEDRGRTLGRWEQHTFRGNRIHFMPVARLDPADQRRRVPHSLRLAAGYARYRARLPRHRLVQAHRADVASVVSLGSAPGLAYFIHTQANGITSVSTDSLWRYASGVHERLEARCLARARQVVVFNEDYARDLATRYPQSSFSPTWWDPDAIARARTGVPRQPRSLLWVGRMERPKDPLLAVEALEVLSTDQPGAGWSLTMIGDGTMFGEVQARVQRLRDDVRQQVRLLGRRPPDAVMQEMARGQILLMTSMPGYEGFPRVLVEAMASGMAPVVTEGSDTGQLIDSPLLGMVTGRAPEELAAALVQAAGLDGSRAVGRVAELSAPEVVARILRD